VKALLAEKDMQKYACHFVIFFSIVDGDYTVSYTVWELHSFLRWYFAGRMPAVSPMLDGQQRDELAIWIW